MSREHAGTGSIDSDFDLVGEAPPRLRPDDEVIHYRARTAATGGLKPKKSKHKASRSAQTPSRSAGRSERADLHDTVWKEIELLEKDDYRRKLWNYVANKFHCPRYEEHDARYDARYSYKEWHGSELPHSVERGNEDLITIEKLELLLGRHETYFHLLKTPDSRMVFLEKEVPKLRNILTAYACANENMFPLVGAIQMCAVIYVTTAKSEAMTFYLLQVLTKIVSEAKATALDSDKVISNAALLVIDETFGSDLKLCKHFNSVKLSVVDFLQQVTLWMRAMFSHHFNLAFLQRVVDLLLVGGYDVITALAYGLLMLARPDFKVVKSASEAFDIFQRLPQFLSTPHFSTICTNSAETLFCKSGGRYIQDKLQSKDWYQMKLLCGVEYFAFHRQIGDAELVKRDLKKRHARQKTDINQTLFEISKQMDDVFESDEEGGGGHGFSGSTSSFRDRDSVSRSRGHLRYGSSGGGGHLHSSTGSIQALEKDRDELRAMLVRSQVEIEKLKLEAADRRLQRGGSSGTTPRARGSEEAADDGESGGGLKQLTLCNLLHISTMDESSKKRVVKKGGFMSDYQIALVPIPDIYVVREVELNIKDWTGSWKALMGELSHVPHFSMQGYLFKLVRNSFGKGIEKRQKRYFVIRESTMTYLRTQTDYRPKADRCIDLTDWIANPCMDVRSPFGIELVSPPVAVTSKKKKRKKSGESGFERHKYVLIPTGETDEELLATRDQWIQGFRMATRGAGSWERMLHLQAGGGGADAYGGGSSTPLVRRRSSRYAHKSSYTTSPKAAAATYAYAHDTAASVMTADLSTSRRFEALRSQASVPTERTYY